MGKYRAHCFDGHGNVWVEDRIHAQTDQEAINAALAIAAAVKLELREGDRIVTIVDKRVPDI